MKIGIHPAPTDNIDGLPRYLLVDATGALIVNTTGGGSSVVAFRYPAINAQQVKAVAGSLLYISCVNRSNLTVYMQVYDHVGLLPDPPLPGSTPIFEWEVGGVQVNIGDDMLNSVSFVNGIYVYVSAVTTTRTAPVDTTLFDIQGVYS